MDASAARRLLEGEWTRLRQARAALELERDAIEAGDGSTELSPIDQHQADAASDLFEREKDLAILGRITAELRDVDDALARLDAGTYGRCTRCGREIGDARLAALPATRFCDEHQRSWELTPPVAPPTGWADDRAGREAARHLDYLPDDDELLERIDLGPEEAAVHVEAGRRPLMGRLSAATLEWAEALEGGEAADEHEALLAEEADRRAGAAALVDAEDDLDR